MSETNKAVVRRWIDEAWNKGNVEVLDEIIAKDSVHHIPHDRRFYGPAGYKRLMEETRTALPDVQFSLHDMIAEGDKVAVRWTFTGTHMGQWIDAAPTGKPVAVTGTSLLRFSGGRFVEELTEADLLGMRLQLGLIPDPATLETNKVLVRRFIQEILNKGDLSLVDEVFAADALYRGNAIADMRGTEAVRQYVNAVHCVAFPDTHFTIEELIAEGDMVVCRFTFRGTHKAEWGGIAPTGKQVAITGTTRLRICGGKIADHWCDWDALGGFQQLGLVTNPATLETNKALVRRFGDEVIDKGNLEVVEEVLAADYAYHLPHFPEIRGHKAFRQHMTEVRTALPDFRWSIDDMIAEGDTVMARSTITGTHQGQLMGKAPTGKSVTYSGTFTFRIVGGRLAEAWADWDALGFFQQLGLVAPLGQARAAASSRTGV